MFMQPPRDPSYLSQFYSCMLSIPSPPCIIIFLTIIPTNSESSISRPMFLLGFLSSTNRVYLGDKDLNIVAYQLQLSVLQYQTAVMRGDLEAADKVYMDICLNLFSYLFFNWNLFPNHLVATTLVPIYLGLHHTVVILVDYSSSPTRIDHAVYPP